MRQDTPSIAVLPLHNLTGDPEQEFFQTAGRNLLAAEADAGTNGRSSSRAQGASARVSRKR